MSAKAQSASSDSCCSSSCCGGDHAADRHAGSAMLEARFTLRPARQSDLPAVRTLLAQSGLPTEDVDQQFGSQYAVAVTETGDIVGVEGYEVYGDYGLLRSAAVDSAWRGRGIGDALTRDRIATARAHGLVALYGLTTTADRYFPRFGFAVVDRRVVPADVRASREFAGICPSSATTLELRFDADVDVDASDTLRARVREKYGEAARRVQSGEGVPAECCASTGCCGGAASASCDPITSNLYDEIDAAAVPSQALLASLGCGNPTALAELRPGEIVLDLGSGGGIDVLLSAKRVGPTGKAYGLDMTDDMLALARENQRRAGAENVEFLKGEIEHIPLPDASVDVIISNCVINLAADKRRVLREAFRVLKPGGRFAVSDVVVRGDVPAPVRKSMELWIGCVAGALEEDEYRSLLAEQGFAGIDIEPTRIYRAGDARSFLTAGDLDADVAVEMVDGKFMSAFVRATKPQELATGK